MGFWSNIKQTIRESETIAEIKSSTIKDLLSGNILSKKFIRKQYKFILLFALLTILYIGNRIVCERQISKIVKLEKQLTDIKYESLTVSVELTRLSRRTYILNYMEENSIGLKQSPTPPILLQNPNRERENILKKEKEEHQKATENIKNDTTTIEE